VNNREIASVAWIVVAIVWALVKAPDFRASLSALFKSLLSPKLALPLLGMVAYVAGLAFVGSRVGLWDGPLLSDTLAWFLFTGFGLFGAATRVFERRGSFGAVLRAAIGITVLVEVFINLYVFQLLVELVLVPVLAVVVGMSVVAGTKDEYAPVKKFLDGLLGIVGVALITFVAVKLFGAGGTSIGRSVGSGSRCRSG
jgi:hypothetical protein